MKLFGLYETKDIEVKDLSLKDYINLRETLNVKSHGRNNEGFDKMDMNVVEKLINYVSVPGHRGKKHKIMTGHSSGKYTRNANLVLETLKIIEEKKKENPIQILVKAIENAAPRDEITVIEYGGARYPQAVDVSPMRRLALSLRHIVHGAYDKAFNKKVKMYAALADEIIMASDNNGESFAIKKKNEAEKQADSAR